MHWQGRRVANINRQIDQAVADLFLLYSDCMRVINLACLLPLPANLQPNESANKSPKPLQFGEIFVQFLDKPAQITHICLIFVQASK